MATNKEEISKLLTGLDPLKISDMYDQTKEALKNASPDLLMATAKPEDHKNEPSFLTPEQQQLLMPDIDIKEPKGDATLSVTPTEEQKEIKESNDAVMRELPHFTSGLNHAQTMALAEEVKETLINKSKTDTSLYDQFDDTLTKLFEEIKNNDVLSDGQKSALLMKVNMISSTILKESFEVNV